MLSFIPSTLLKILVGKEYQKLSLHTQTKLIQELNLTPSEVERSVGLAQMTMERAVKTARESFMLQFHQRIFSWYYIVLVQVKRYLNRMKRFV